MIALEWRNGYNGGGEGMTQELDFPCQHSHYVKIPSKYLGLSLKTWTLDHDVSATDSQNEIVKKLVDLATQK